MNEFRQLNEQESRAIMKSRLPEGHPLRNWNFPRVSYERMQGGFCVCLLLLADGNNNTLILRGASRRSYKDRKNRVRGEMLAFLRAIRCSRPVRLKSED